ncbi:hypothetical protein FOL47_000577 [Perkinsus chesapeaki]|uniref:Uncharacterized protein n=1 Tax=Perkinsus chesapeaki TaxID=330153 RepID=A0A7J6MMH2_PERCH|nr:hypothetical protein FOL47_000577 [Perkinsus chesapeaki]
MRYRSAEVSSPENSSDEEMLGRDASSPPPASSETSSSEAESTEPVRYTEPKSKRRRRSDHPAVITKAMIYQPICRGLPITRDDVGRKQRATGPSSPRAKDRYITVPGKDLDSTQVSYTADSDLVAAVIHSGQFDASDTPVDFNGLRVVIEVDLLSPVTHFLKIDRNGITSRFRPRRSDRPTLAFTIVSVEPLVGEGSPLVNETVIELLRCQDEDPKLRFLRPYKGDIDSEHIWLEYSPLYVIQMSERVGTDFEGYSRLYREDMYFHMHDGLQFILRMEDPSAEGEEPRFMWLPSDDDGFTGLSWNEIEWGFRSVRIRGQICGTIQAIRFAIRDHVIGQLAASDMKWFNKVAAHQPLLRGDVDEGIVEGYVVCDSSEESGYGIQEMDDASSVEDSNVIQIGGGGN